MIGVKTSFKGGQIRSPFLKGYESMDNKLKVVLYLRYSSHKQNEQSIEGQQRICEDFAKQQDYNIVDIYIDRATSAKTDHRPSFLRIYLKRLRAEC